MYLPFSSYRWPSPGQLTSVLAIRPSGQAHQRQQAYVLAPV